MIWGFALIDRDGVRTGIQEPIGWEGFSIKIKRHPERHGTFMEIQGNNFQFVGKAMELLKMEYEIYGSEGIAGLALSYKCGAAWASLTEYSIDFNTYNFVCGTPCYVAAAVQKKGSLVNFLNRFDQKVNVDSNICFDEITPLTLASQNKQILLPSKSFLLKADAENLSVRNFDLEADPNYNFPGNDPFPENAGIQKINIAMPLNGVNDSSLEVFAPSAVATIYPTIPSTPAMVTNQPSASIVCTSGTFSLDVRTKGRFKYTSSSPSGDSGLALAFLILIDPGLTTLIDADTVVLNSDIIGTFFPVEAPVNSGSIPGVTEFDISFVGDVEVPAGSKIYAFHALSYLKFTDFPDTVEIEFDPETHFRAEITSVCVATEAKLRMINEVVDHVIESITNTELKLYSEYYGRIDSSPYAFPGPGCGALRAVTMGLDIRRVLLKDGTNPKLFLSMKDCFDALNAIDNIGIGLDVIEDQEVIRMENWKFFYKETVSHHCAGIERLDKSTRTDQIFSIFKTGFDKWEAESFAGLDEFLTKRNYRLQLKNTQNTLERVCSWIASGYAIETTRRFGLNDKDWRYDNNAFIICLSTDFNIRGGFLAPNFLILPKNTFFSAASIGLHITITGTEFNDGDYTITGFEITIFDLVALSFAETTVTTEDVPLMKITLIDGDTNNPQYTVELGNIECAANIVDPLTLYNYRISPARMAMRWFDRLMTCYRKRVDEYRLIFTDGDGNYIARGTMQSDICKIENGVLRENASITPQYFIDPMVDGRPIYSADAIKYDHPLSAAEFQKIQALPMDLIGYSSGCERGQGWIDELEWFPNDGKAKFNLIPKMDVELESNPIEGCDEAVPCVGVGFPDMDFTWMAGFHVELYNIPILVPITGTGPFLLSDLVKPSSVTIEIIGSNLVITQTGGLPEGDAIFNFTVNGCDSTKSFSQTLFV